MSRKDAWQKLREDVINELDIRSQYETWGVKFTGSVSSKGWAECYAISRDEKNPSAGVNLRTGIYKDFAGETLTIFDFAVKYGHVGSWQEAQEFLARAAGFAKRIPKKFKPNRPVEKIDLKQQLIYGTVLVMRKELKVSFKTIEMTGAKNAQYPCKSLNPQTVVAFPVYDAEKLLDVPAESFVLQCGDGNTVKVFQGKGLPYKEEKRIVLGSTGILNKFALENLKTAERVYKTEGVSDMLALQEMIPEELRKKHIVITNACGTDDSAPAWALAPHLVGKEVVIIHDRDTPGQFGTSADKSGGAQRWVRAMSGVAKSVKNVQLPYEMEEKHGKDLKDWIHEGHNYQDFLQLVADSPELKPLNASTPGSDDEEPMEQVIARRLQIVVIGSRIDRNGNNNAVVFNVVKKRMFYIKHLPKWTYTDALQQLGAVAQSEINEDDGSTAGPKLTIRQVRNAIAILASARQIDQGKMLSDGVHHLDNELLAVVPGGYVPINDELTRVNAFETSNGKYLIDSLEKQTEWLDVAEVRKYMQDAKNPQWRESAFKALVSVIGRWGNFENARVPEVIGSLMIATWAQSIWTWRPWISITGRTNSGKTTLFGFMAKYFGEWCMYSSNFTCAGIRQELGLSLRPVLLDEFESSDERDKTLNWLKGSGSTAGAVAYRGTPAGDSLQTIARIMPWFAGIEAQKNKESERNRYISILLKSRDELPRFEFPSEEEIVELRNKSMAILFQVWRRVLELTKTLVTKYRAKVGNRYVDSWALPSAMQSAILGLSDNEALECFEVLMNEVEPTILESSKSEENELLEMIMSSPIQTGVGRFELASTLISRFDQKAPDSESTNNQLLEKHGIKVLGIEHLKGKPKTEERYIFLVGRLIRRHLLKDVRGESRDLIQLLKRLPNALSARQRMSSRNEHGVAIPFSQVICDSAGSESEP